VQAQAEPEVQKREEEEADDELQFEDDPSDPVLLREARLAAALRRAGADPDKGKGKGKERADTATAFAYTTTPAPAPATAPVSLHSGFDAPPTHRAYLTGPGSLGSLPGAFPLNLPTHRAVPTHPAGALRTPEAVRAALDERIAALRGVDEVVWSLVAELSRLKSAWEVEDGVERREDVS
jgi:hypothetical protein